MINVDELILRMEYVFQFTNDLKIKLDYLNLLTKHINFNKRVFHFLENAFLTDENYLIKIEVFKLIYKLFPSKLENLTLYALENEDDNIVFDLFNILEKINIFYCRFYMESILRAKNSYLQNSRRKKNRISYSDMKEVYFRQHLEKKLEVLYFHRHEFPLASDLYGM